VLSLHGDRVNALECVDKKADFYYQWLSVKNRHSNAGEKGWHIWKHD
jgi:hypothetical protein